MTAESLKNATKPEEQLDLEVEAAPGPKDSDLKKIATLGAENVRLADLIARLEAKLKETRELLRVNTDIDLPNAFAEVGSSAFSLEDGTAILIEDFTASAITEANKPEAFAYLHEVGFGALVKHELKISYGMGEEKSFVKFLRDLKRRKNPPVVEFKDAVAPATLGKFVRDRLKEGWVVSEDYADDKAKSAGAKFLPKGLLSIFQGKRAKVTMPGAKK